MDASPTRNTSSLGLTVSTRRGPVIVVLVVVALLVAVWSWMRAAAMHKALHSLRFNEEGVLIADGIPGERPEPGGGDIAVQTPPNCFYAWVCWWQWWPPGQVCQLQLVCD